MIVVSRVAQTMYDSGGKGRTEIQTQAEIFVGLASGRNGSG